MCRSETRLEIPIDMRFDATSQPSDFPIVAGGLVEVVDLPILHEETVRRVALAKSPFGHYHCPTTVERAPVVAVISVCCD